MFTIKCQGQPQATFPAPLIPFTKVMLSGSYLGFAPQVDLYGFGADSKGNWNHYWENNPSAGAFRKTGVHDGDFEHNVTATLAAINKIRIFKGR